MNAAITPQAGAVGVASATPPPLPCLNSNICATPTPYQRKQLFAVTMNMENFLKDEWINHTLLLTLTFKANIREHKQANACFHHLTRRDFAACGLREWVKISERQKRGAWHFHVLARVADNVRKDYDFDKAAAYKANNRLFCFVSDNQHLERVKRLLLPCLRRHGMGIFSVEPIRVSALAVAKYLAKYVSKDFTKQTDKGVRRVNYSRDFPKSCSMRFAWNTAGAREWRARVREYFSPTCADIGEISERFGAKWAFYFMEKLQRERMLRELAIASGGSRLSA